MIDDTLEDWTLIANSDREEPEKKHLPGESSTRGDDVWNTSRSRTDKLRWARRFLASSCLEKPPKIAAFPHSTALPTSGH